MEEIRMKVDPAKPGSAAEKQCAWTMAARVRLQEHEKAERTVAARREQTEGTRALQLVRKRRLRPRLV
eukprot:3992778-Prymnesium_polylepis.2